MGRTERISRVVKTYDPLLYCEKSGDGKLCIYRKSKRIETYFIDGQSIQFVRPAPFFVCALTHNWKMDGRPVDWGIEPILARLNAIDLWKRDLAEESIKNELAGYEAKDREFSNSVESFLYEFRSQFAKTFNDVNTASMAKKDLRKERENGNC